MSRTVLGQGATDHVVAGCFSGGEVPEVVFVRGQTVSVTREGGGRFHTLFEQQLMGSARCVAALHPLNGVGEPSRADSLLVLGASGTARHARCLNAPAC